MLSILKKYMEAYMKKVILLAVLSSFMLSGCSSLTEYLREYYKEPVLAGPFGDPEKIKCDEECQADKEAYMEAESKQLPYRVPQPYDTYEYQVQINGKTVTCRPGLV